MSRDNLGTSGDESAIELKIWAKPVLRNVKCALRLTCVTQKRLCLSSQFNVIAAVILYGFLRGKCRSGETSYQMLEVLLFCDQERI